MDAYKKVEQWLREIVKVLGFTVAAIALITLVTWEWELAPIRATLLWLLGVDSILLAGAFITWLDWREAGRKVLKESPEDGGRSTTHGQDHRFP
jgi:hypothetical protein